jgi:hypothetical protein
MMRDEMHDYMMIVPLRRAAGAVGKQKKTRSYVIGWRRVRSARSLGCSRLLLLCLLPCFACALGVIEFVRPFC